MFRADISVDKDLLLALKAQDHFNNDRATLSLKKGRIEVRAKDIIAFKATMHGLIKLMEAYEKTSSVIRHENRNRKENKPAATARTGSSEF